MIVGATISYSLSFYCQILYNRDNCSSETVVTKAPMLDLDTNDEQFEVINAYVLQHFVPVDIGLLQV